MGTYVVFRPGTNTLTAFRITATNPPTIVNAWSVSSSGRGSPFVTSTDGTNNVIVWAVGSSGDQRLHGHNGDTGAVVYNGGGANELMTGTRGYNTAAIAARGRIYVANNNKVYAFNVPTGAPTPPPQPDTDADSDCYTYTDVCAEQSSVQGRVERRARGAADWEHSYRFGHSRPKPGADNDYGKSELYRFGRERDHGPHSCRGQPYWSHRLHTPTQVSQLAT